MNATAAIALAFLKGEVLTIKTAFKDFGISNLPRECGRAIERRFGVKLARVKKEGKTKYGVPCWWNEYRLPTTAYNAEGRKKMQEYVKKELANQPAAKTDKQAALYKQQQLLLK
jgi:hypothetical protein